MLAIRDAMRLTLADTSRGPWFQRAGRIRYELGESETAMALRVGELLEDPEAVEAMPVVVARLVRLREERRAVRRSDVHRTA